MSVFSDFKCGAMSEAEFHNACARMNREDRYYEAREAASMYYHDDDECDEDCEHCTWTECPEEEMGGMYRLNIYEDYPHGEFKYLEPYACYAHDREEAKRIALRYAQEKYKGRNVSVSNTN